ncbi:MAG: hypothetical protein OXC00_09815 [Acidimicrobiaceae bacterium]|nr:hypothetical protein [Acidimicrobiaceae bacterium]
MSRPGGLAGAGVGSGTQGGCRWTVERLHGPVADLLEWAEPPVDTARVARIHVVEMPGLVLGSTQRFETADQSRIAAAGAAVSRRRSGGGAVLLSPGSQVWADFFIPDSDPLWSDDVAHAALWVGELWAAVIEPFVAEPAAVHSGRLVADRWGRLVCFAGAGPGEVFVGGLKVVGVSQRRSRRRVRIQTTARVQHPPAATSGEAAQRSLDELELLDITPAERVAGRAVMASRCGSIAATEADLTEALIGALPAQAADSR